MVDAAIEPDVDGLFLENTLACEVIGVMRIYFYRGEVIIDKTAPIFRRRKLFKNYLIIICRKKSELIALFISSRFQDISNINLYKMNIPTHTIAK